MITAAAPSVPRPLELARRAGSGLDVALFWSAADGSTSIEVRHGATGETLRFVVPREAALDAFYHPFAHLPFATAP